MEFSRIIKNFSKLPGNIFNQIVNTDWKFFLQNFLIFSVIWILLQILPRQRAFEEINEHVYYAFDIISATLLNSKMVINWRIPGSSCKTFIVFVGNMGTIFLDKLLGKPEVNNIDGSAFLIGPK